MQPAHTIHSLHYIAGTGFASNHLPHTISAHALRDILTALESQPGVSELNSICKSAYFCTSLDVFIILDKRVEEGTT